MPHDRFFTEIPLHVSQEVIFIDDEAHHLHVMRKNVGDTVELVNGQNILATAHIKRMEKKRYILTISDIQSFPSPQTLILAQAIPRINRLDHIIEKGTELGATEFRLYPGDRSEKKQLRENDLERLQRIMISAMKQCGRFDLPVITLSPKITELKELPKNSYFGDVSKQAPLFKNAWENSPETLFFIGPESGFSPQETAHLKSLNTIGVRLHPYILRTETAPLVALSLIQNFRMI